ncbi:MAG: thiolase family protein, partial [bacterium]|nr:thiolase family protein [bacterium]
MPQDVWVLGTHMTPFRRYIDKDAVDLACTAALGALEDGGVGISDMDILACGTLFQAGASMGQQVQKQIGQTGIPVYNVSNACATGATALR